MKFPAAQVFKKSFHITIKPVTKVQLQMIITGGCCSLVSFIFTKYLATETSDQLVVRNTDTRGNLLTIQVPVTDVMLLVVMYEHIFAFATSHSLFGEFRSYTKVNLLGALSQRWGSPGSEVPSPGPLGSPIHAISKKWVSECVGFNVPLHT